MNHYHKLSLFILVVVIAAAVTCLASKPQFSEIQNWNIEALASSETYVLSDCRNGLEAYGLTVYDQFCHEPFHEDVIYDCEYSYKVPFIGNDGKCVLYVY